MNRALLIAAIGLGALIFGPIIWSALRTKPCRAVTLEAAVFDGVTPVAGVVPVKHVYDFHEVCLYAENIVIDKGATVFVGKDKEHGRLYASHALTIGGEVSEVRDAGVSP